MRSFKFVGVLAIFLIAVIYLLSAAAGDVMMAAIVGLAIFVTVVSGFAPSSTARRGHSSGRAN